MKIFDAQVRSDTRTEEELRNLHYFGTERVVSTAHDIRRFELAEELLEYFRQLVEDEAARLRRCDLVAHVALGVLPPARPRRAHYEVWRELPEFLRREEVVAVGEIGAWEDTRSQWELFTLQAEMARDLDLPVIVTPPSTLHVNMTYKMMQRLQEVGLPPHRCMLNRVDERTAETVHAEGFVAGISVGFHHMEPRRAATLLGNLIEANGTDERIALNSALQRGAADILGIPKTVVALGESGVASESIQRLAYANAFTLFVR